MRYRLRTLLILLAALPPVLAAMWFFAIPFLANNGPAAPLVLLITAVLLAPMWLPFAFLAYAVRFESFTLGTLGAFLAVEASSIFLNGFLWQQISDL